MSSGTQSGYRGWTQSGFSQINLSKVEKCSIRRILSYNDKNLKLVTKVAFLNNPIKIPMKLLVFQSQIKQFYFIIARIRFIQIVFEVLNILIIWKNYVEMLDLGLNPLIVLPSYQVLLFYEREVMISLALGG